MEKIEIKIDRSTLPRDGQIVRFDTYTEEGLTGQFFDRDELILTNDAQWKSVWEVYSWEPLESYKK